MRSAVEDIAHAAFTTAATAAASTDERRLAERVA